MGRQGKRVLLAVVLAFLALAPSACWSRREIETLGFVLALGVDRAARQDLVQLTVQVAKPVAIPSGTQAGGGGAMMEKPFWTVGGTGRTAFEALRNLHRLSPRRLYLAHNRHLIFGEEAARQGVGRYLDFFLRHPQSRRLVRVMVVEKSRAADLLQAEFELEPLPAEGLFFLEEGVRTQLSTGLVVELGDFLQMLEDEGIEPVAERVELVRKLPGEITGKLERREVLSSPKLSGAAAFKGDRLVGWLDERETRGLLWVKGEVRGGTVVVPQPEVQGKFATLEILRAKSKVRPVKKDDKVAIAVKVETEAELREAQTFLDPVNNRELLASIERRLATAIKNEILAAVRRAQADLRSDIFGFGATVHRSLPRDWRRLRDNWDGLFPSLPVEVEVKARLRRSGLAGRSIQIK